MEEERGKESVEKNTDFLGRFLKGHAIDVYGVANFSHYHKEILGFDETIRDRFPFAVSFGLVLTKGILSTVKDGPNPLYLHHYRQLNYKLDMTGYLLSREIENRGYGSLPLAASQVIDWKNHKAHVSHKHLGEMAGVGWMGRNNLLVHPQYGAHVRYNTVLTDMPLEAGVPLDRGCGTCRACVNACPGGAIKDEPMEFDHLGCFALMKEYKNKRNLGHYICGICVEACKGER